MADNGTGRLYSIDVPNYELHYLPEIGKAPIRLLPEGMEQGFAVPCELRHRWELHVGRSQQVLPILLEQLGSVDIFVHDSEHTYENMMREFKLSWPYLTSGGLLISDDATWNHAFIDFARAVKATPRNVYLAGFSGFIKNVPA